MQPGTGVAGGLTSGRLASSSKVSVELGDGEPHLAVGARDGQALRGWLPFLKLAEYGGLGRSNTHRTEQGQKGHAELCAERGGGHL